MSAGCLIIAIDGPAGSGKSTVAKAVAQRLGIDYLDTGALYRAVALWLDKHGVPPEESERLREELRRLRIKIKGDKVYVDGCDVTEAIRSSRVDAVVSAYSALPTVRECLFSIQRAQVNCKGLVADGRDMGTVVFPEAQIKVFLTASPEERARRRWLESSDKGGLTYEEILKGIRERDAFDSGRSLSPLRAARDACVIDTTGLSVDEVVDQIIELVKNLKQNDGGDG
jgi:cytidylate kinase